MQQLASGAAITSDMQTAVLDACQHSTRLDPQSEGPRTEYLLEAAKLAGVRPQLEPLLSRKIRAIDEGGYSYWEAPVVAQYLEALQEREEAGASNLYFLGNYEEIRAFISKAERCPSLPFISTPDLPESTWAQLSADLAQASDPKIQRILLGIFNEQKESQHGRKTLLEFTQGDDERLARAAVHALANMNHPTVRALGLELLTRPERRGEGLRLLARDAEAGDEVKIRELRTSLTDSQERHDFLFYLPEVVSQHPSDEFTALLAEIYPYQPCSACRHNAVETLLDCKALLDWLRAEAWLDANQFMRAAFVEWDGSHSAI